MILPNPAILVITDRTRCREGMGREALENRAAALFRGGCRWLSLREKDLAPEARLDLLRRLISIGVDFGATVGVHDDFAAAKASGCALHLPALADAAKARRDLGDEALLGQSCHGAREIAGRQAARVDYVTMSPVFDSAGKPGYGPALGPSGIAAAIATVEIPVLALGGVTLATLPLLKGTGSGGVAIMGEAMTAPDPTAWFAQIAMGWQRNLTESPPFKTRD